MWWEFLVYAAMGYGIGSIPTGLIVGRVARGIDIREFGSGKTGFTNVLRTVGARWGVVALIGDLAKGVVPVVIARLISDEPYVVAVTGLAVAVGHDWPLFAGFRGGRGVAASYGVLLGMNPIASLAMLPVAAGLVATTRIMSVMTVGMAPVAAVVFVVLAALEIHPWAYAVYAVIGAALLIVLHRENIERLLAGTEPKIGSGGDRREASSPSSG
ncbi:MAG: glycerol-3-phosphate 1-O-acyltransferase PlsY [Dehalococcoidia bacterium]